jgi:primosomal protein N' (replication factor Y) (superfamily II helicase)
MPPVENMIYASVLLDSAIDRTLDYAVPSHLFEKAKPGVRVLAPIKRHLRKGTILALKKTSEVENVQPIAEILSETILVSEDLFRLAYWVSSYYCAPLRKVLQSLLPSSIRSGIEQKTQLFIKSPLSKNELAELCRKVRISNSSQAQVLDVILEFPKGLFLSEILEKAQVSRSPIDTLIKKGILICSNASIDRSPVFEMEYFKTNPKLLNSEQKDALDKIKQSLSEKNFNTHLIHGVTGSGKTEVYLQAIEHALSLEMGAILLVPEIALTAQTLERLKGRFEDKIAILHYRLSDGERRDVWHHIREGHCKIVVGARSAIFSPVVNLGLIIVDEEHESSYKQSDDLPCYHARDVAVMRGKLTDSTVVLGSATPSLESYYNAKKGKYILSALSCRADTAALPEVSIVDMRFEYRKSQNFTLFSEALLNGIKKRIENGEQCLLFLNRRGFHTSQLCTQCAHVIQCPHCDVSLTHHLSEAVLSCHLCDYRLSPAPKSCPNCKSPDSLKYKGAGTEQVERALHAIFPQVRTLRLDADTTRHKGSHDRLFKQFRSGKADVLIGTQMVAKGLHFPMVTLVGVLNADISLSIPDFRASESVFQLITQVSGRSGRGALRGEVIIQTQMPDQETILLASNQDYIKFYEKEIEVRKLFNYPPFSHFIKFTFSGTDPQRTLKTAQSLRTFLIQSLPPHFELHPVIPCGHAKIKDKFRFQFLIKGNHLSNLAPLFEQAKQKIKPPKDIRILINVDPTSTFF